jgi:CBS domain-containing protein
MTERSLKDLFHLVKQVLPGTQELITFSSEMPVAEALEVMRKKNISQVPVKEGDEVLGEKKKWGQIFILDFAKKLVSYLKKLAMP